MGPPSSPLETLKRVQDAVSSLPFESEWTFSTHVREEDGYATLDLHGLDQELASLALTAFVEAARERALSPVRIIHGVGHHSPGRPVLKDRVLERIEGDLSTKVRETREAPGHLDLQLELGLPPDLVGMAEKAASPRSLPGERTDLVAAFVEVFFQLLDGGEVPTRDLSAPLQAFTAHSSPLEKKALARAGVEQALARAEAEEAGLRGDELPPSPPRLPSRVRKESSPFPQQILPLDRPPRAREPVVEVPVRPLKVWRKIPPASTPTPPSPTQDSPPSKGASPGLGHPLAWALLALMAGFLPSVAPLVGGGVGLTAGLALRPSRPHPLASLLLGLSGALAGGVFLPSLGPYGLAVATVIAVSLANYRIESPS